MMEGASKVSGHRGWRGHDQTHHLERLLWKHEWGGGWGVEGVMRLWKVEMRDNVDVKQRFGGGPLWEDSKDRVRQLV